MHKSLLATLFAVLAIAGPAFGNIERVDLDPNTVLAEIDQTPFGSQLLSMVAVHMATNGPLDELIVLLNQISSQLKKDQATDDDQNRTNQANCDTVISSYRKQIAAFTQQRNENIKIRDVNQAALNVAEKDLHETIAALNLNAKRLSEGQAERDSQHNNYAQAMAERDTGIKALDGALQLLSHLQSGTSFLQLKKRFARVTAELQETSKSSSFGHLYTPLISALSEVAATATPEMLSKIVALFNDLRQTFTKDKQTLTITENKQMEDWTSLKVDLETERDQLQEKRADLERQIAVYTKNIAEANKNIAYLTKQLEITNKNLAHTIEQCNALSAAYGRRSRERARELSIINKVVEFFQKRAKGASDFIRQRVSKAAL